MKIAIITFSDFNTNYGSMLQSFSLGHYLKKQGHDVVWIKYREFTDDSENRIALKSYIKKILLKLYAIYRRKDLLNTKQNFEAYKQKWLKYTALYVSEKELEQMTEEYDCCICGSDQIWNPDFEDTLSDLMIKRKLHMQRVWGITILKMMKRKE